MPRRKSSDHEEIAATLRAARRFVQEAEAPMTSEEVEVIMEVRQELPRPEEADLTALAREIAKR